MRGRVARRQGRSFERIHGKCGGSDNAPCCRIKLGQGTEPLSFSPYGCFFYLKVSFRIRHTWRLGHPRKWKFFFLFCFVHSLLSLIAHLMSLFVPFSLVESYFMEGVFFSFPFFFLCPFVFLLHGVAYECGTFFSAT